LNALRWSIGLMIAVIICTSRSNSALQASIDFEKAVELLEHVLEKSNLTID
jgi:hypothetical protein